MHTTVMNPQSIKQPIALKPAAKDLNQMLGIRHIPFKATLCLEPLIDYIEQKQTSEDYAEAFLAKTLMERVAGNPVLRGPIEDRRILKEHAETFQMMMLFILPPALRETQMSKISAPFEMDHIYCTPAMEKLKKGTEIHFESNQSGSALECSGVTKASSLILNRLYGQNITIDPSLTLSVKDKATGLVRYFKTTMDFQFLQVMLS